MHISSIHVYRQILWGEGHYAIDVRISVLSDDKCYLLSECLVNLVESHGKIILYNYKTPLLKIARQHYHF